MKDNALSLRFLSLANSSSTIVLHSALTIVLFSPTSQQILVSQSRHHVPLLFLEIGVIKVKLLVERVCVDFFHLGLGLGLARRRQGSALGDQRHGRAFLQDLVHGTLRAFANLGTDREAFAEADVDGRGRHGDKQIKQAKQQRSKREKWEQRVIVFASLRCLHAMRRGEKATTIF